VQTASRCLPARAALALPLPRLLLLLLLPLPLPLLPLFLLPPQLLRLLPLSSPFVMCAFPFPVLKMGQQSEQRMLGYDGAAQLPRGQWRQAARRAELLAAHVQGVEWFSASNGSPVLKDAIAYMECRVVTRLETPDHWITYCEVTDGTVLQTQRRTAVHHRKVGNYY
jgi:hypothetical protein